MMIKLILYERVLIDAVYVHVVVVLYYLNNIHWIETIRTVYCNYLLLLHQTTSSSRWLLRRPAAAQHTWRPNDGILPARH